MIYLFVKSLKAKIFDTVYVIKLQTICNIQYEAIFYSRTDCNFKNVYPIRPPKSQLKVKCWPIYILTSTTIFAKKIKLYHIHRKVKTTYAISTYYNLIVLY